MFLTHAMSSLQSSEKKKNERQSSCIERLMQRDVSLEFLLLSFRNKIHERVAFEEKGCEGVTYEWSCKRVAHEKRSCTWKKFACKKRVAIELKNEGFPPRIELWLLQKKNNYSGSLRLHILYEAVKIARTDPNEDIFGFFLTEHINGVGWLKQVIFNRRKTLF